jgi:hypothetical protein
MRKLLTPLPPFNASSSSLQIQVKVFFEQLCLSANALVKFLVLRWIWAVSDGFPAVPVRPNRNHQIFRQRKSFADSSLNHNFELQGRFLFLHGTASRDIGSAKVTRSEAFFSKTQNPRRAGQGSAGGWLEASNWTRCHAKDPRNSSVVAGFLQARFLGIVRVLCTTLALAVGAIAFAVCSPAAAQMAGGLMFPGPGTPASSAATLSIDGSALANSSAATTSVTLSTTKSNDIIVVAIEDNGGAITGVTGGGLTWARRATITGGGSNLETWWALAASPLSGVSITVTPTSSGFTTVTAFGVNGAHTAAPWDVNAALPNHSSGTPSDPRSATTTASNTMIIGAFRDSTSSPTAGAGYTAIQLNADFALTEYQIVSSPQTALAVTVGTGVSNTNGGIADAIVQGP